MLENTLEMTLSLSLSDVEDSRIQNGVSGCTVTWHLYPLMSRRVKRLPAPFDAMP
jgi:hypothetical protein